MYMEALGKLGIHARVPFLEGSQARNASQTEQEKSQPAARVVGPGISNG
jgi:hypothetical protein